MISFYRIFILLTVALSLVFAGAAEAKSRSYCEGNLIATHKAIEGAIQSEIDARKAAATLGVGAGCGVISLALLGLDLGLSTLICTVAMAGTYATLTVAERKNIANRVYYQVRDPRCMPR